VVVKLYDCEMCSYDCDIVILSWQLIEEEKKEHEKRNKKENKIDIGELLLRRDSSSNGSCSRPVLNLLQYRVKY
jgi:hypothetical protein